MSSNIGSNIELYMRLNNMTMKQLGDKVGRSESTVSYWISGKATPRMGIVQSLADIFNITTDELINGDSTGDSPKDSVKGFKVPVLGYVAGGIPIEQITDILDYEELSIDMKSKGEFFALKIKGNSMAPRISDGDVVIVRKQNSIENGEIAIVAVNGDEATCKKVNLKDNGIVLIPLNTTYEPMFYSLEEINDKPIKILGKVVELRAKF